MARIRHLAILTEDVEKLVKFYTSAFGLKIVHGVGTATYLSDGHINLAIIPIGPEREVEGPHLQVPGVSRAFPGARVHSPHRCFADPRFQY
jgi:catechol 2,3-dioxygenase-like lactoylglutathione lyase family enzyme